MQSTQETMLNIPDRAGHVWRAAAIVLLAFALSAGAFGVARSARVERVIVPVRAVTAREVALTSSAAAHEAGPYAHSSR